MCIAGGEWWYIYGENDKKQSYKSEHTFAKNRDKR